MASLVRRADAGRPPGGRSPRAPAVYSRAMQLAYDRQGIGPTLVLLHPLGADRRAWAPVIDRLAAERDVIALDLPGFGGSPVLEGSEPPTPSALATAVGDFLDGLQLAGRYHVAGNSLGGWVALELAAAGRVLSVTAIAPAGLWPEPLRPKCSIARKLLGRALPAVYPLLRVRAVRRLAIGSRVADGARVPPEDALSLVRTYLTAPGFDAVNAAMRASQFIKLERIQVPVTLVWPDRDELIDAPAHLPPRIRSATLHDAGHMPMWDAPERVASVLLQGSSYDNSP